jgi:phage shock protein C
MNTKLSRSHSDYMLGGVCGGIASYLKIDSTLVRLFFLVLMVGQGSGLLIYLILWIIMPREDRIASSSEFTPDEFGNRARQVGQEFGDVMRQPNPKTIMYMGIGLILAGLFFFVSNLNLPWLHWINRDVFWPLLIIVAGIALLVRSLRKE